MHKLLLLALLAITWNFNLLPCYADPIGPKPGELVTVDGFQMSITADSQVFTVNTPITINTFITNVTEQERPMAVGYPVDYHIQVKTSEGEEMPLTRWGQRRERNKGTSFGRGPLEILPGANYAQKIILNQLFDMTIPGDYTVKVSRYIRFPNEKGAKEAVSNTLHITVR